MLTFAASREKRPMGDQWHIAISSDGKLFYAVCALCGLKFSANNEMLLKRVLPLHVCKMKLKADASSNRGS